MPESPPESPSAEDLPAGGTAGSAAAGPAPARRSGKFVLVLACCAAFAYLFDQATKFWVVGTMVEGQTIPVLPPLLSWHFIRNPGAAFSIGEDYTWIFSIVMACVAAAILFYARRVRSIWWAIALGFLLGGALGNLTDRLFREPSFGMGHVVDFIAFPNFAIFNIADSAIVGAVILWCILTLLGIGMDGRRAPARGHGSEGRPEDGDG
ncbi:signal peptidase II [Arthrobacter sp. I2-34]|uniref:Lipoprotein signal peptidase n=1 Tax=Arthrobacter hankyongi TaxID=2904801 RepID=A0ABS9LB10_9MICC|nr:signal peptidase II [Arthrobacter hankyongi]MCG2623862.1 signal peptidase II [Arthrobacter hankyongi]